MKTINIEVKTYINKYESVDGRRFDNAEDCKAWENSYKGTLIASWNKIKKVEVSAVDLGLPWNGDDHEVYMLRPNNIDEIALINAYVKATTCNTGETLTAKHIDELVILNFGYDHDYCDSYSWFDYIKSIRAYVAKKEEELDKI